MQNNKYRVWCKSKNEWEKDKVLLSSSGILYHMTKLGTFMKCKENTHIVQFFTGLLDRNGKEIYEGDICKREGCGTFYQVTWKEDRWSMLCLITDYYFKWRDYHGHIWEVIGNIYENPELLKGVDKETL